VFDASIAEFLAQTFRMTRRDEDQLDRVVALMAQQVDQRLHTIGGHVAEIALLLDAQELFDAAENAWNHLKHSTRGAFLHDGLSRVDFFADSNGSLVVNEFENLDATYTKLGSNSESTTRAFLRLYYSNKIAQLIQSIN
jgi:hypothetical protein